MFDPDIEDAFDSALNQETPLANPPAKCADLTYTDKDPSMSHSAVTYANSNLDDKTIIGEGKEGG